MNSSVMEMLCRGFKRKEYMDEYVNPDEFIEPSAGEALKEASGSSASRSTSERDVMLFLMQFGAADQMAAQCHAHRPR